MRNLTIIFVVLAIVSFCIAGYYIFSKIQIPPTTVISETPTKTSNTPTLCAPDQLSGVISSQGAAGNIYATLTVTNTGKTSCEMALGNIVKATFDAKNIVIHYVQTVQKESFMLATGAKVYSQIHYPNGPQCQSGTENKQVNFLLDQPSVIFKSDTQTGKLMIPACRSETEKTTIDIWPLSNKPITQ